MIAAVGSPLVAGLDQEHGAVELALIVLRRLEAFAIGAAEPDHDRVLAAVPDLEKEKADALAVHVPRPEREVGDPAGWIGLAGRQAGAGMDRVAALVAGRYHDEPPGTGKLIDRPLSNAAAIVAPEVASQAQVHNARLLALGCQLEDVPDAVDDLVALERRLDHCQVGLGCDTGILQTGRAATISGGDPRDMGAVADLIGRRRRRAGADLGLGMMLARLLIQVVDDPGLAPRPEGAVRRVDA